jgi:1-deoxy-D-xylulose-5-phosphate synthase
LNKFGDLKTKSIEELEDIAQQVRQRILEVVSKNGGHLSSTLGATDIIVAMHAVFDATQNPFIFDVSHQAYAHKLLTGRWDEFATLRQFGGLSGFTKPNESNTDYYMAGHSSTSISLATGAAKAIALKGEQEERIPIAMIGDGSMSA